MHSSHREDLSDVYEKSVSGCESSSKILLDVCSAIINNKYSKRLDHTEIEDLVQNAFLKVLKSDCFDKSKSSFSSWFCLIAKQEFLDYLRKKYRKIGLQKSIDDNHSVPTFVSTLIDDLDAHEKASVVDKICARSFSDMHLFLYLHYYKNLSMEQCSIALNIPLGTLKSRLFRASKIVRKHFEQKVS
jgi:RNA polymerase sigma-70 factor (ECF subfamily)